MAVETLPEMKDVLTIFTWAQPKGEEKKKHWTKMTNRGSIDIYI